MCIKRKRCYEKGAVPFSLYIHIPFCRKKCPYCDFYSEVYKKDIGTIYVNTLSKQIDSLDGDFRSIYIGGGTPTVLEIDCWKRIFKSLKKLSKRTLEFTIEANPESLDRDKVRLFLDAGVNRLSIGVQSLKDSKLKKLGRPHSAKEGIEKIALVRKEGFENISMDLIFGVWGESLISWKQELQDVCNLGVTHISTYSLTYEKNTPIQREMHKGNIRPLDNERVAKMYEYAIDYLPKRGFLHYEISNFAKQGFACRHNLNYWENGYYLGLGPYAVSYRDGVRERNTADYRDYIERLNRGDSTVVFREKLSSDRKAGESAALKIRTKEGIDFRSFKKAAGVDFLGLKHIAVQRLMENGLIRYTRKKQEVIGVHLTKKGFLFCDNVSADFL